MTRELLNAFKHFRIVFGAETKRLVAYRLQFWCELFLSSAIELFVALTVWRAVYEASGTPSISGYTLKEMLLYATLGVFFGQAVRGTNIGTFARDIYDGSLTKYLIYPLSIYSYKLGTFLPRSVFAIVQLGIALLMLRYLNLWPEQVNLSVSSIGLSLVTVALASMVYFLLLFSIEAIAFWADNVWALSVMLQAAMALLSGRLVPVDLFPQGLQTFLSFLPFPYLVYFPAKVFLGAVSTTELLKGITILIAWISVAALGSRGMYRWGLHKYTGVGM